MFFRLVNGALFRQKGKMLMVAFTIALGASLATAMLNVMLDVGDKVNRELKTYGANINVIPKEASLLGELYDVGDGPDMPAHYLDESELGRLKTIFWAFNIVDFTPYLDAAADVGGVSGVSGAGGGIASEAAGISGADAAGGGSGDGGGAAPESGGGAAPGAGGGAEAGVRLVGAWFDKHLDLPTGEALDTGMRNMKQWWDVEGAWLSDSETDSVMLGSLLAARVGAGVGDTLSVSVAGRPYALNVKGIFNSGSDEDDRAYAPLALVQSMTGRQGSVSSVEVSALTTPDNELSRRAAQNPNSLSVKEWETWYCTAYVSAICYQIEEVLTGAAAKPIRQVAESEGAILEKTQLLMLLITVLSLVGSALGISNLVTAGVMERSREIGLLKALGANNAPVSWLVIAEILITGAIGGVAGYFAGLGFAQIIGHSVFGSAIAIKPMVIPIVAVLVFVVTVAGSLPSIRLILSLRPAEVLHGR